MKDVKICLVGSSGGHLSHLYMLKPFWKDKNRFWVTFDKKDALPVYSLSNKEGLNGASTILYPQVQEDLKKEFPNGYYVLPSSIHEVLIVDQSFVEEPLDLFALKEAVLEVNYQVVDPSEFLSNEVYEVKGPDFQLEKATFLNHKKEKNMER